MDATMSNMTGGLALRGVLLLLFGIAAVFWPGITLVTLVYLFSAFVLLSGVIDLVVGLSRLFRGGIAVFTRVLTLIIGALEVGVGVYLLRHVGVGFTTLVLLIGFLLVVRGVFEIVEGLFEPGSAVYRTLMVIVGLFAIAAGVIMLFQPVAGGVAFVWILGLYGLITGPLLLAGAVEVNRVGTDVAVATTTTGRSARAHS